MKKINVLAFGAVADIVGKSSFVLPAPSSTDELKEQLETDFPALKSISYAVAVNKKMITASTALEPNATVALLPPFSGG
jgi:sulfur-carrier protein